MSGYVSCRLYMVAPLLVSTSITFCVRPRFRTSSSNSCVLFPHIQDSSASSYLCCTLRIFHLPLSSIRPLRSLIGSLVAKSSGVSLSFKNCVSRFAWLASSNADVSLMLLMSAAATCSAVVIVVFLRIRTGWFMPSVLNPAFSSALRYLAAVSGFSYATRIISVRPFPAITSFCAFVIGAPSADVMPRSNRSGVMFAPFSRRSATSCTVPRLARFCNSLLE